MWHLNTTYFIRIKKVKLEPAIISKQVTCQRITSKILDLDGLTPEPAIRSGDTGQQLPCFDSCQLITTLMCPMCAISVFLCSQTGRKCEIEHCLPCGADRRSVYGHVITKFSGMGRFTYPWCSAGALRARSSAIKTQ